MSLRDVGAAPPLPEAEREALWTQLAIYLNRSGAALGEAWRLGAQRVRALPVFAQAKPSYELPVAVANAAGFVRDPSLLRYAEELRERVGLWFGEEPGQPFQRAIMECAIEHGRSQCGEDHHAEEAFQRLFGLIREKGTFGVSEALLLRAGKTEVFPHMQQRVFSDEELLCLVRHAGVKALSELSTLHKIRLPLREPLPTDLCVPIFPVLQEDWLVHPLLHPASRAHEHPTEAAAAFTATARAAPGSLLRATAKAAAVLSIAAGLDEAGRDQRALEALKNDLVWVATETLHFPRVRQVVTENVAFFAASSPAVAAVRDALGVFGVDAKAAAKLLAASAKLLALEESETRLLPLLALFRIAMVRGLPLAAHRIVAALPKPNRADPIAEIARFYAEAGDFAGMRDVLAKLESVNWCRPDQTNPLALAVLRSLPRT